MSKQRGEFVPIDSIQFDPNNVRKHNDKNLAAIRASLLRFGQVKPIVVDANNVVIAGNGTLEVARSLNWETIWIVRTDLIGEEATAYAIADNRTAELAEWDFAKLSGQLDAMGAEMRSFTGFDETAFEKMKPQVEIVEDEVPEPPADPVTKPGDLWILGEHRLLCGDSTNADDVRFVMNGSLAQLVYTDPPYGVGYDGGTVAREKLAGDGTTELYEPACKMSFKFSDQQAALYLWHAGVKGIAAAAAAAAAGYEIRCELVWNKNLAQFGALSAQYKQKHEPCYYCHKRGKTPRWFGPTNEVTVWDVDRASKNEFHPTQKPVELAARAMNNSSREGDLVVDWFLGSGSTLIAAEQLNRRCYGIEISPAYCDVIVARWEKLTGRKATREQRAEIAATT